MAGRRLIGGNIRRQDDDGEREGAPLGGTRAEAVQRLQVGLLGIGAMVLMIGLASVVQNRAQITEATAVPDAAPTTEPTVVAPQRDPLADAGVVPDIPTEPEPVAGPEQAPSDVGPEPRPTPSQTQPQRPGSDAQNND